MEEIINLQRPSHGMVAAPTTTLTYHMKKLETENALELLKSLDFRKLEIGYTHSIEALEKFEDDFDYFSYHHYNQENIDTEFEEFRKNLEQPLKICERFNVKYLSFHPKYGGDFKRAVENLKKLEREVDQKILLENFPSGTDEMFFTSPEEFRKLKKLRSNAGIVFDVGHGYKQRSEFLKLKDDIKIVHLQDANPREGKHHLPIGEGDIDFNFVKHLDAVTVLELKHGSIKELEKSKQKVENQKPGNW